MVGKTESKFRFIINIKKYGLLYLMMLPGLVYLVVNNYIPMAGLIIAFKDINFSKGLFFSNWVGFDNFKYLFSTSDAWVMTRNTLLYNIAFIVINNTLAVIVAIMLNELTARRMERFYQSVILLPFLISIIIIAYIGNAFMSTDLGFINRVLLPLIGKSAIPWYSEPGYWPFILIFVNAWYRVGYLCVIYLSAIIGIDIQFYEAAALEGATKIQQIRYITLPLISPVIITMVLISVGRIFYADFGLFYQVPMNSGALFSTTQVIDTYVYRGLMQLGDIGMSSAACLYQSVVGFILVMLSNIAVRKISPENALF
jgi:putative aldouronate transport system permease protein